jgi:hypothetical protein
LRYWQLLFYCLDGIAKLIVMQRAY